MDSMEVFFNASADMFCIASLEGSLVKVNPAFIRNLGYSEEFLLQRPIMEFIHPEDVESTKEELEKLAAGTPTFSFENRCRRSNGAYLWLSWSANPDLNTGLFYAVAREVTEARNAIKQTQLALDASPNGMITINERDEITYINDAAVELFQYDREELMGRNFHILVPESVRPRHPGMHRQFLDKAERRPMGIGKRLTGRRKDGNEIPLEIGLNPVEGPDGSAVICGIIDLSLIEMKETLILQQQKKMEEANKRLEKLASYDTLTGLVNRRVLFEETERITKIMVRQKLPVSVAMIDIDKFKSFNDSFGHQAGDLVLKDVGRILREASRSTDIVARYGGEEFCVFFPGTSQEGAVNVAERMRMELVSFPWKDRPVTASFGVFTLEKAPDLDIPLSEHMIRKADKALYQAKHAGRNRVVAYEGAEKD